MGRPDDLRVAILLATYNGEKFLDEQIASIASQTIGHIDVWASDDGSTDGTIGKLQDLARAWPRGRFEIVSGPRAGFAENFRALLLHDAIVADFYAYADQDDIWDADKLERAIAWLGAASADEPRLYCGRTRTMRANGEIVGNSPLFSKPPSFANALVQSIAGGNTMVFNRAARDLLIRCAAQGSFVTHDWWTYQVISGADGAVFYDPVPSISYRQHAGNVVGENSSWRARLNRIERLWQGQLAEWTEQNLANLERCGEQLSPASKLVMRELQAARRGNMFSRLLSLGRSRVYRQTALGNLGLIAACIVGKL